MSTLMPLTDSARQDRMGSRRSESLLGQIERIARAGDRMALEELHTHRPTFRFNGSKPLLFVEFVDVLRDKAAIQKFAGHEWSVLERAYDLTIDKYTTLTDDGGNGVSVKRGGAGCRHHFQRVVDCMDTWKRGHPRADPLQVETAAARTLQRHVVRQFCRACMEARRGVNPARTRYAWPLPDGVIYVWMPAWLQRRKRREWLEMNVQDPDPSRPGEQRRAQDIIDDRLGVLRGTSLGSRADQIPSRRPADHPMTWLIEHEVTADGLAQVVADEKAHTLGQQRPAIQALGKPTLRRLILSIFEDMSEDRHNDSAVGQAFGLSKATFSRFAGSRWQSDSGGPIPDLWVNTARVLAYHGPFVEAAKEAGVWPQITRVLHQSSQEVRS